MEVKKCKEAAGKQFTPDSYINLWNRCIRIESSREASGALAARRCLKEKPVASRRVHEAEAASHSLAKANQTKGKG